MGRNLREAVLVGVFAALYLAAAMLGRATVIGADELSLVWPAAGVAVLWLLTLTRRAQLVASAALLVAATVFSNVTTGTTGGPMVVVTTANVVQVAAILLLLRWWCPELGRRGGRPPLESTGSLMRFLLASALGCLVGVLTGAAGLTTIGEPVTALTALSWWGRNTCGVLAAGTTGLLLIHHLAKRGRPAASAPGGPAEAASLIAVTLALFAVDHVTATPFTFLLPATTVWAGLRFQPLVVSAHAALGGIAVVWLTLNGHGLFGADLSQRTGVLLAQMFVGMTIMLGLFLAASRQEGARLQAELTEHQRDLAAFSRRAAHDLQNPLMVVEGWAGLLAAQLTETSAAGQMVARIQSASEQMRRLIDDLLTDATARDRELVLAQVDLAALAGEVAEGRAAHGLVRISEMAPVCGDPALLRQLLDNLVGNALKYVEPGTAPDVEVSASADHDGMVTVQVRDRGIGIPAGSYEEVFTEFTRAHGDAYPGTGLGLSICRRIAERHGGTISALPRPGGGSTFEVRLPRWQALPTPRLPSIRSDSSAHSERQEPWKTVTSQH